MTDITELAQRLKAAANTTADAIDRLKAFPGDELIDLSQHEGEQVDIDITTLNEWYELSNPANVLALVEALEKSEKTSEARREAIDITHKRAARERDRANAAEEALEKAQQEAEELSKFKEVMASAADALKAGKPLNLESLFKGELASAMFAMMFAGEFVRSGATNYLELLYDVPEFGEMTVTLQKVEGKTPGQRIAELESRTVTVKPMRPGHITVGGEKIGIYMRDEVDEFIAALAVAGIKVEAE
ncbi:ead/Ea22-like family protein [Klebsiella quasipneumoniae]|uniref:ead/Ea22-like family protein n=1 Tax=Klebsiella quasipneumoniae TaxID=1463165 RepID=UPI003B851E83